MPTPAAWSKFLQSIEGSAAPAITLVGPLFEDASYAPAEPTVFIDGGSRVRPSHSPFLMVSVGDGDSLNAGAVGLDEILPTDKNYSDLAFVLKALPSSVCRLRLLGFLGGRRDHELANFGEVHAFLSARAGDKRIEVQFADQVTAFCGGQLEREIHGTFSVFALSETTVEISGACSYPFAGRLSPLSSVGLSNEGSGRVYVKSRGVCS